MQNQSGATAVEFALLAPIWIALVLMAMQISLALHKGNTVQWAVNKAARAALLDTSLDEAGLQAYIETRIRKIDAFAEIDITYSENTVGTVLIGTISGTYYHDINVPLLPDFTAEFNIDVSVPRV
ncbi:MAG: TadE/TadG family type IV pilus assembly protein [Henriciella sp.]